MDRSFFEEESSFKMLGFTYDFGVDWDSYIISIATFVSKKIGALVCSMKFFSSSEFALYLYKCTTVYGHAWNIVVISGLVLLVATWNY